MTNEFGAFGAVLEKLEFTLPSHFAARCRMVTDPRPYPSPPSLIGLSFLLVGVFTANTTVPDLIIWSRTFSNFSQWIVRILIFVC